MYLTTYPTLIREVIFIAQIKVITIAIYLITTTILLITIIITNLQMLLEITTDPSTIHFHPTIPIKTTQMHLTKTIETTTYLILPAIDVIKKVISPMRVLIQETQSEAIAILTTTITIIDPITGHKIKDPTTITKDGDLKIITKIIATIHSKKDNENQKLVHNVEYKVDILIILNVLR